MTDPLLAAALTYAEQGFPVFPLSSTGIPIIQWSDVDSDYDETAMRWIRHERAGIGVKLGREADLWLLDVDMPSKKKPHRANGVDSLEELTRRHGPLPRTMTSRSPGGGYHLWFRYPDEGEVRNTVCEIGPSLDTKGKGGMGILPPTKTQRGAYTLVDDEYPAIAPKWLIDLVTKKDDPAPAYDASPPTHNALGSSVYGLAALRSAIDDVASTAEGARHKELCRSAFNMGRLVAGGELDLDDALSSMEHAGRACGLPEREVTTTVKDSVKKGMMHPRCRGSL